MLKTEFSILVSRQDILLDLLGRIESEWDHTYLVLFVNIIIVSCVGRLSTTMPDLMALRNSIA